MYRKMTNKNVCHYGDIFDTKDNSGRIMQNPCIYRVMNSSIRDFCLFIGNSNRAKRGRCDESLLNFKHFCS